MRFFKLIPACVAFSCVSAAWGQPRAETAPAKSEIFYPNEPGPLLRADIRLERTIVQAGQPVWAELSVTNLTDKAMPLQVPGTESKEAPRSEMGLPLSHVFSGKGFSGVTIKDRHGDVMDDPPMRRGNAPIPVVHLAPHASVGARVDLSKHYESLLRRPGKYTLTWKPYGGTMESEPVTLSLLAEQQATILTDYGKLLMRFYYEQAPRHTQNFIELVNQRFYDNLTFNRIVAGEIIQGGSPTGDRTGVRPDGKRIPAEFSKIPFGAGTVGMARSRLDPDSASCQFFICLSRKAAFDGDQTAFAYLVGPESFETLNKIAAVPTDPNTYRPQKPVLIRAISLDDVPAHDRNSPGITISNGSRPATVERDLEPSRYERQPSPQVVGRDIQAAPTAPDISPARRLARASRLLSSTQPARTGD